MDGVCGNGTNFCGAGKCQSGDCTKLPVELPTEEPWLDGNSTDGTCGGPNNYVCNPAFGYCCSSKGVCGSEKAECGTGW